MSRTSAGLLLYRQPGGTLEVLVAHPGGPLWARKDDGVWSIPKGLLEDDEDPESAARREFEEETGHPPPDGPYLDLGDVRLKSGKRVRAFAVAGDLDPETLDSGTFKMAWPPRGGRMTSFPEIDRVAWLEPEAARVKLNPAQAPFIDRLLKALEEA